MSPGGPVVVRAGQQLTRHPLGVGLLVDVGQDAAQLRMLGADHPQQATQPALLEIDAIIGQHHIDVGCGSGRAALPLTGYLNREGRYAGFDVLREPIAWCTEIISGSHPHLEFRAADVQSKRYNPKAKYEPSDFRFPYPDGSFDVVLLASVCEIVAC